MLSRALGILVVALLLPLLVVAPRAAAVGDSQCPAGTNPVSVGSGVVCVVVTDPGEPGSAGNPGNPGDPGRLVRRRSAATSPTAPRFPARRMTAPGGRGNQCYAAPYDAPPGTPAWQGHTDGSLWQCTSCTSAGVATTCNVQIMWTAPGQEPGPPTPEELAATALGLMPLAKADIHTAPEPPAATYIGVENWLWIPDGQWATLHKSVTAGATTVTVKAAPSQTRLGPRTDRCHVLRAGEAVGPGHDGSCQHHLRLHLQGDLGQRATRAVPDLGDHSLPRDLELLGNLSDQRR